MTARSYVCYAKVPVLLVGGFEDEPYFDFGRRDVSRDRRHRLDRR